MDDFLNKRNPNASFVVKNLTTRTIKVFNQKIGYLNSIDLMKIPGISENMIKESLLKGTLYNKINAGELQVTSSDLNILASNATQKAFLTANSISSISATRTDYSTQAVWYIDSTSGVDTNTGLTSGDAIKTWSEYIKRVGLNTSLTQRVDIYILNNLPITDPMVWAPVIYPTGSAVVHGTLTSTGTGTFTAVTARAAATNTACSITDTSRVSWTAGTLMKITGGTAGNIGAAAWVAKDLTANAARMSTFIKSDSDIISGTSPAATECTPVIADTYALYSMTTVHTASISPMVSGATTIAGFGKIAFENIRFVGASGSTYVSRFEGKRNNSLILHQCSFASTVETLDIRLLNCCSESTGNLQFFGGWNLSSINAVVGGLCLSFASVYGKVSIFSGFLMQGNVIFGAALGSISIIADMGVFDWGTSFPYVVSVTTGGKVVFGSTFSGGKLWGSSAVAGSYPLLISSGNVYVPTAANITAVGALTATQDFVVNGRTTMAPFDYAASPPAFKALLATTWVNLRLAVASTGFGGVAIDPQTGNGISKDT